MPPGAFSTLAKLQALPPPLSADPRIDLVESDVATAVSDFARALQSARAAIGTAQKQDASLLVARSRINEAWALNQLNETR